MKRVSCLGARWSCYYSIYQSVTEVLRLRWSCRNRAAIMRHLQQKQTNVAGNRSIEECFWTTEANHHSFVNSYPVDWLMFFVYFERASINGNPGSWSRTLSFLVNRSYLYSRYWTGTGLELRLMRGVFSSVNEINLILTILPHMSLHCMPVPVKIREYECGLLEHVIEMQN